MALLHDLTGARRLVRTPLELHALTDILHGRQRSLEEWPADIRVVGAGFDVTRNAVMIYLESEAFDWVLPDQEIPLRFPLWERLSREGTR